MTDLAEPTVLCVCVVYPNGERVFEPYADLLRYGVPFGAYIDWSDGNKHACSTAQ